jgi:hypothetical protein
MGFRPDRAWPRRLAACLAAAALALASASPAEATPLDAPEVTRLERGETVVRPETVSRGDRHYVGGVTYTVLDGTPSDVDALFDDIASWNRVLPMTRRARLVGTQAGDRFVELSQGNALVSANYTIRLRRDKGEVKFWLEPSFHHDIDDAWGFFRFQPFLSASGEPKGLLTYAILVDVGPGIVRELFEEKVRTVMLSVPQRMKHQLTARLAARRP